MTSLAQIIPYAWCIGGLILLVLEVLIPGVYLLFLGIAALVVGIVVLTGQAEWLGSAEGFSWADGFSWEWQVLAFIVLSTVAVIVGRRSYGPKTIKGERPALNSRADRLVGVVATLSEPIVGGSGKVAIEDGWWIVRGPDLPLGARVRVTGATGAVLTVVAEP